jgi:hypothetical protein
MENDWLIFKKYPHIGKPLTKKDSAWIRSYVTNPTTIAKHKFTPLLHRTLSQRKYRPVKNASKNNSGKRERSVGKKKQRHIFFPSHLDSIIYSYYNYLITGLYEEFLKDKPYKSVPVAYRKIPLNNSSNCSNKSNIEFAYDVFKYIEDNKNRELSIIVSDITSFFDNLDHRILHKQWKLILNSDNLPEDHYSLYKSLVHKKFVNENELFGRFQHKLWVQRFKPNDTTKKELKRKKVAKIYNLRKENVVAFCTKEEFYDEATDLIRVDKPFNHSKRILTGKPKLKGIPQGTPISATLANIYMIDFDKQIYTKVNEPDKNAYYQRYSDDLIIVCDQKDEDYFFKLLQDQVEVKAKLEIQRKKTNIYRYSLNSNSKFEGGIFEEGKVNPNKQLEYLGFTYDGNKVFVKSSGFSKFYRTMKRSIKRGSYFARQAHIPSDSLFETKLYKRFTHVGSNRRLKYLPDPKSPTGYSKSTQFDWGNFISYLNKANSAMKPINGDDTIKNQYSKVWTKFHVIKNKVKKDL